MIDYKNKLAQPIFGGELSYKANITSLSRDNADFDPITQTALNSGQCDRLTADPTVKSRTDCILRGMPGNYSRGSAEATWRRTLIDPWGQKWTPFVTARVDLAALSVSPETGVGNFLPTGDSTVGRIMPAVGLEYRYPFISVQPWGTQTIEPIAQLIVRPNESQIGKLPNEDAQSLMFDDSNLFSREQVLRLGPHRGRHAAQCRRAIHRAVQSRRLRQRAVRAVLSAVRPELLRGRRTRSIPA